MKIIKNLKDAYITYRFLLKQLVLRDFKVKYKRSVLGVFWSVLNPILTALVFNFVFSNILKTQVDNYIIFLLSGLVMFNYFSEATNLAMYSVVGSASLITKVYIPKYIFPLSKILSSAINLGASLIALLIFISISDISVNWNYLLLPFVFVTFMMFALGIGYILSSLAVFFRDTQFLYGIVLMLWMYFTPIMYPESIISPNMQFIFSINPLYYYIKYFRIIIIDGNMPGLIPHVLCLFAAIITLILGLYFFKRKQDQFIMHI